VERPVPSHPARKWIALIQTRLCYMKTSFSTDVNQSSIELRRFATLANASVHVDIRNLDLSSSVRSRLEPTTITIGVHAVPRCADTQYLTYRNFFKISGIGKLFNARKAMHLRFCKAVSGRLLDGQWRPPLHDIDFDSSIFLAYGNIANLQIQAFSNTTVQHNA
jgi:hypothetical protein